jgi:predicted translin family RNA/ssDNA-binding protein
MLDKNFWLKINEEQAEFDKDRRIIISQANDALHKSKQAIFALHRDNLVEAKEQLASAGETLNKLEKDFGTRKRLRGEGSWCAACEEFSEASLFCQFVENKEVGKIDGISLQCEEYLGGLSDYTGELLRRAILQASDRKFEVVKIILDEIREVIHLMLQYNLTGPLRTKFDQAKKNLHKIEEMYYEINLKN